MSARHAVQQAVAAKVRMPNRPLGVESGSAEGEHISTDTSMRAYAHSLFTPGADRLEKPGHGLYGNRPPLDEAPNGAPRVRAYLHGVDRHALHPERLFIGALKLPRFNVVMEVVHFDPDSGESERYIMGVGSSGDVMVEQILDSGIAEVGETGSLQQKRVICAYLEELATRGQPHDQHPVFTAVLGGDPFSLDLLRSPAPGFSVTQA